MDAYSQDPFWRTKRFNLTYECQLSLFTLILVVRDKNDIELLFIILQTQQIISLTHLAHTIQDKWDPKKRIPFLNTMFSRKIKKNLVKI